MLLGCPDHRMSGFSLDRTRDKSVSTASRRVELSERTWQLKVFAPLSATSRTYTWPAPSSCPAAHTVPSSPPSRAANLMPLLRRALRVVSFISFSCEVIDCPTPAPPYTQLDHLDSNWPISHAAGCMNLFTNAGNSREMTLMSVPATKEIERGKLPTKGPLHSTLTDIWACCLGCTTPPVLFETEPEMPGQKVTSTVKLLRASCFLLPTKSPSLPVMPL
mmetsp:Transcript_18177/g.28200  ORF Transcript_18177/g.28200 Transcript_18177/m.28200 type:complete len:219 (+) Transcript_18177:182-838(+)